MSYVIGVLLIGLLGWFAYKQIALIVKDFKKRKQQKLEKTQSDEQKEE